MHFKLQDGPLLFAHVGKVCKRCVKPVCCFADGMVSVLLVPDLLVVRVGEQSEIGLYLP